MRIAIIGHSGSGKSTLARNLGKALDTDVMHMDKVHFAANWQIRAKEEKERMVKEFLDSHTSWIIDGNYTKLEYQRRMDEAELIVLLLFSRAASLRRVYRRYRMYKGRSRPDMTIGCQEKLDAKFIKWVLFGGRSKEKMADYLDIMERYGEKTLVAKNQKQLDEIYKKLAAHKFADEENVIGVKTDKI